ncbi:DUF459 domain-containing protein [Rhodoblastus acidophilus]|uniref:DUF459 domain-containing protein n=1 Tax=Candidatus Rhodoblastus alkanivorans TaxID=2954117 RepID=A0ABS9Z4S7_9HYPH|nr:SGNH family hydrolase [Candidatus Rhodoblastus alkanivorans]MCI4680776.1 DUF459 domain-containing protein [Candidatus Rhodoblastus alkanivorans]MCI4682476.1 DUF459 domain-containing protein [Candidatus Rhodoblastus alkanivorans]MDI4639782.1 DUF459 domain-containing protein [Rhodoblastus acidophilus]
MPIARRLPSPGPARNARPRQILFGLFVALVLLAGWAPAAAAQNSIVDFFGSIFTPRGENPPVERRLRQRPRRHNLTRPAASSSTESESRRARSGATAKREALGEMQGPQQPPSFFIAVIGDSQANMLAQGLAQAFASDPRVEIINKAKVDSGLVRDDFYDWRAAARALVDGPQHIDVAVIEIGINDNQKLRQGAKGGLEPLGKPFNDVYAKRVEELARIFRDKNIPLVWVGLPIMRSQTLSNAALVFNDIDRQYAEAQGAHFVDLWEAFSDENSAYRAWGPDVNGAIVRLRSADGVHFNKTGARKAAHFVEPEIRKVLEAKLKPPETPANPAPTPAQPATPAPPQASAPAAPAPKPIAGKVESLTDAALSPGGALAPAGPARAAPDSSPVQPGRADDFRWPAK